MRYFIKIILLIFVLLLSGMVSAQEPGTQTSDVRQEPIVVVPDLADIIPFAAELSGRLAVLKASMKAGSDISAIEKNLTEIETNITGLTEQFQRLKDSQEYKYNKLVEFRETLKQGREEFEHIGNPLRKEIRQLGDWKKEWLTEQARWQEWQSSLLEEEGMEQLDTTFADAHATIETALSLVLPQLGATLTVQQKAGNILANIQTLFAELDGLLMQERRGTLLNESPPMYSFQYRSQFKSRVMWFALQKGLYEITLPDSRFFEREGWIVLLQWVVSLIAIIILYRYRKELYESKSWCFLAARPVAAGLFLGFMTTLLLFEYEGTPGIWKVSNTLIGGIAFARLMGGLLEVAWKKQFVYGLMGILITTRLMDVLSFPLPLFRLYTFFAALFGLLFCLRWDGKSVVQKDPGLYPWSLRVWSFFFAVIVLAEILGKKTLAVYLFAALIRSLATVLVFMLLMHIIRGGLEWLFRTALFRRATVLHSDDTDAVIERLARFVNIVIWGLVLLPALLLIWGVYDTLEEATSGLLALRFTLGDKTVSIGLLIVASGIVYGAFFISWLLRTLPLDKMLIKRRVERGVRLSIERLLHYLIIAIGFLWALGTLGFELTQFTIILSALSVGIGFGLQGVVNNFFSGLILLFERPVRVGDYIDVNGVRAEIRRIGLRSTTDQTLEQANVIIPNADLISNTVTNWTLSSRRVRLSIPVGVAYGSDVPRVMELLMACAKANTKVATTPAPQVLFFSFGESSLDFELRVWVLDVDEIFVVKSDLHHEIDRLFREAQIEIPFPQRDLHLRSVDDAVIKRSDGVMD